MKCHYNGAKQCFARAKLSFGVAKQCFAVTKQCFARAHWCFRTVKRNGACWSDLIDAMFQQGNGSAGNGHSIPGRHTRTPRQRRRVPARVAAITGVLLTVGHRLRRDIVCVRRTGPIACVATVTPRPVQGPSYLSAGVHARARWHTDDSGHDRMWRHAPGA